MSALRRHDLPLPKVEGEPAEILSLATILLREADSMEQVCRSVETLRNGLAAMTGPAVVAAMTRLGVMASRARRLAGVTDEAGATLNRYVPVLDTLLIEAGQRAETDAADHRIAARCEVELAENRAESARAAMRGDAATVHRVELENQAIDRELADAIAEENSSYDRWLAIQEEIEIAAAGTCSTLSDPAQGPSVVPLPLPLPVMGSPLGLAAGEETVALLDEIASGTLSDEEIEEKLAEIDARLTAFGGNPAFWSAFTDDPDATDAFLDFLVFAAAPGASAGVVALGRTLATGTRDHLGAWTGGLSPDQQAAVGRDIVRSAGGQRAGERGAFAAYLLGGMGLPDGVCLGAAEELDRQLRINHGTFADDGGMDRVSRFLSGPYALDPICPPQAFDIRTVVWDNLSTHPNAAYGFLLADDAEVRGARRDFWFGVENAAVTGAEADGGVSLMGGLDAAVAAGSTGATLGPAQQERTALYMIDLITLLGGEGPTLFDHVLNDEAKDRLVLAFHPYVDGIAETFAENSDAKPSHDEVRDGGGMVDVEVKIDEDEDHRAITITKTIPVFDREAMNRFIDASSRGSDAGHDRWENLLLTYARDVAEETGDYPLPDARHEAFEGMLRDAGTIWGRVEGADIADAEAADQFAGQGIANAVGAGVSSLSMNPTAAVGASLATNAVLSALSPHYTSVDQVSANAFDSEAAFAAGVIAAYQHEVLEGDHHVTRRLDPDKTLASYLGRDDLDLFDDAVTWVRESASLAIRQVDQHRDDAPGTLDGE